MSAWTTPITWTNGAVTAASMNTEISGHANWLKAALDLLTNSTAADAGDTMSLYVKRAAAANSAFQAEQTGDTVPRFGIAASGKHSWGSGTAAADTFLERVAAGVLGAAAGTKIRSTQTAATDIALETLVTADSVVRWAALANGAHRWGSGSGAADLQLERATGSPGAMLISGASQANATRVTIEGTSGQRSFLDLRVEGDSASRALLSGDGTQIGLELGPGSGARSKVVGVRQTGWAAATGTKARTTFVTDSATTAAIGARLGALIDDLIAHGLIGA